MNDYYEFLKNCNLLTTHIFTFYFKHILYFITFSPQVLSKNIEENDEIVDDDVNEFLQQFSLDKLNISPQEPANTRRAVDVSPWDPEYTLIPVDRFSCQELRGSERFVPCQDCFIDLNLFL